MLVYSLIFLSVLLADAECQAVLGMTKSVQNISTDPTPVLHSTTVAENLTTPCLPPSINDFPTDIFSQSQRRFGAILLHFFFAFYLLHAIMRVCDDYFMNSLEIIGQKLNLDQDVAGATFMAAGSSAPEVFISLIGVFVSEQEPVIGAIVGSAMFNILFVVGICGILVTGSAKLAIWPFFRDSIFYCVSILVLITIIQDEIVFWFESLFLLCLYATYLIFMMNNDAMKEWAFDKFQMFQGEAENGFMDNVGAVHNKDFGFISKNKMGRSQSGYNQFTEEADEGNINNGWGPNVYDANKSSYQNWNGDQNTKIGGEKILNADFSVGTTKITFATAAFQVMLDKRFFKPKTRFRMAVRRVICEIHTIKLSCHRAVPNETGLDFDEFDCNPFDPKNIGLFTYDMPSTQETVKFLKWLVLLPPRILFHFTIPNCRIQKYKKFYVLTFVMSICWLAVLSYLIVWMITVIGFTLGIPDSLMLITFIAAGTSIPDAYTSMIVVKEGMVDMGVSNIFGSNVFDLLIGLAFPWFIKAIFSNGYIKINSNGLVYDTLLLFGCVLVTIIVIHVRKWHLDKKSGYIFLVIYAVFLVFSAAIELNMFGKINLPTCK